MARDLLKDKVPTEANDWHSDHFDSTGHGRFYRWRLERASAAYIDSDRAFTGQVPAAVRP